MPHEAALVSVVLSLAAAVLFGLAAAAVIRGRRIALRLAAMPLCFLLSEVALLGLSMITWRVHAPVGPGYG
jgi:hypothetical protein